MPSYEIVTFGCRPDLKEQAETALRESWPEFIFHDPISKRYLERCDSYFSDYDVLLLEDDAVVGGGWGVALRWDGTIADLPEGYDGGLQRAVDGHERSEAPDTLSVMAAAVAANRRGGGLAGRVLTALRERALAAGLSRVICPVRPTLKTRYPLTPMADFATWTRNDGLHLDPWIRTHERLGATILAPAPRSMVITGTVAEWERWADMAFPSTGRYVVDGALDTVEIDRGADLGTYHETNLWMRHV